MKLTCICFLLTILFHGLLIADTIQKEDSDSLLQEDELLLEDELLFEEPDSTSDDTLYSYSASDSDINNQTVKSLLWPKALRVSLQGDLKYNFELHQAEVRRSSLRLEYESALWRASYLKLDAKYQYFNQGDFLVGDSLADNSLEGNGHDASYGKATLNAAWFQYRINDCTIKLGRQNLFWGAVEGSYAVDVIAPIDATQPLLTDFSDIRSSQNMALFNCYLNKSEMEIVFLPQPLMDRYQHKGRAALNDLENSLHAEFGLRLTQHWEGFDLSLMYAHLYGNTPHLRANPFDPEASELVTSRYDFWALSAVWAIDRLLVKGDVAYSADQIISNGSLVTESLPIEDQVDIAFGLEYTNSERHQFAMNLWRYKAIKALHADPGSYNRAWNLSWRKEFYHDTLSLSLLGLWFDQPKVQITTFLAEYQWNDFWLFSSAIQYGDNIQQVSMVNGESQLSLQVSLKYQF